MAKYKGDHMWANRKFKKNNICLICLEEKKTDWAQIGGISGTKEMRDRNNWVELCHRDHADMDWRAKAGKISYWTVINQMRGVIGISCNLEGGEY